MTDAPFSASREMPNGRSAGLAIAAGALLTLVAIGHHPHLGSHQTGNAMGSIAALATMDRLVHGAVIALALALAYGFAIFALRRGLQRPSVVIGVVAFTFGTGAIIGAGLIDGFVISDLAERYADAAPAALDRVYPLMGLCMSAIDACTMFGLLAIAVAALAWAIALVGSRDRATRATGIVGSGSALLTTVLLASTHGQLQPRNLLLILLAQTLWSGCAAFLLLTRRV